MTSPAARNVRSTETTYQYTGMIQYFFSHIMLYPIADTTHRLYQVACFSQFLTKRTDMHIHRSCFSIKIISPYMTENLISGHDQTFVFHQILKKFKFFSGQFYFFLFPANLCLPTDNFKSSHFSSLSSSCLEQRLRTAFTLATNSIIPNGLVIYHPRLLPNLLLIVLRFFAVTMITGIFLVSDEAFKTFQKCCIHLLPEA